ncbi:MULTISPECIES: DUF4375 domain-containing protein [Myroides]|uniref:DUF4375 domain-containing protein n=1 Tax=Myroides albus TaxID=2562892 RepID=A0A6I3LQG8_9FLAO|nr:MULTISPECIES: DUF4375 domain-containing protein [Myroides]MTG98382.1 DUF4375 domain-containing protein [Myroides albus]MVX35733.1 DUF4375 domain-containing protein [Myroides sp. LoEW2-1]UVD80375.1 DMP19 family protein [Myroides albus]
MKDLKIVVSENAMKSEDAYDVVYSNITFINLIREEAETDPAEFIHPDAFLSYYVDYYLAEYNNGNFSQLVWNTQADYDFFDVVIEGLEKMGAVKHLAFLQKQVAFLKDYDEVALEAFIETDYFGENPTRDALKNDEFYDIEEDLVELNAKWLKAHPDLLVLSIEGMYERAEALLGKEIER